MLPLDVTGLLQVHDDHQADEDLVDVSVEEVLEHDHVVTKVKSLPVVQKAGIHSRTFLGKEVDCLYNSPCTHIGRALWLIPKLILIILKFLVKEYQNYPVKDFQQLQNPANSTRFA